MIMSKAYAEAEVNAIIAERAALQALNADQRTIRRHAQPVFDAT